MNQIIKLSAPQFEQNNIKEKTICVRAHRERIFRVCSEIIENKLIFHNYGQGGAGWTFLFGCVNESIKQFEQELIKNNTFRDTPISIIGSGCYGLLTAIILTRKGYKIRILAEDTENITSYKSAGFFFPRARKCSTPEERATFQSIGIESYLTYLQIINGEHTFIKEGPKILPCYFGLDIDPGFAPYIEKRIIEAPELVTLDFGNNKQYQANKYKTVFINSSILMEELKRNIAELNIPIIKTKVADFKELDDQIIFNCAGLGAKKLAGDNRIVPVQGHLISLKNQSDINELQYMLNFKVTMTDSNGKCRDELIYFTPKESGILGITFIRGQDSLTANQHEFDRLLQRCKDFFGS